MTSKDAQMYLNHKVIYLETGTEYILDAVIVKRKYGKFVFRAELKDLNANSKIICKLDDISLEPVTEEDKVKDFDGVYRALKGAEQ